MCTILRINYKIKIANKKDYSLDIINFKKNAERLYYAGILCIIDLREMQISTENIH